MLSSSAYKSVTLQVIECNLDDMSPELFPHLLDELFKHGALDAWIIPIVMKGGRPAQLVSALCRNESVERLCSVLFQETTTLGLRISEVQRFELERSFVEVETEFGRIPVKIGSTVDGKTLNAAPEYKICKDIADSQGIPLKKVFEVALLAFNKSK